MKIDTSMSTPHNTADGWVYYIARGTEWVRYGPYMSEENAQRSRELVIAYLSGDGCVGCNIRTTGEPNA